jgi:TetR/AcrR family transcriptional regulator, lmrAB and yxaGH operons repressor
MSMLASGLRNGERLYRLVYMESQTTRARLLEAAITLMRRSGLSGAGINEIVRESGAPKGSVYYFFPEGKQQIVSEALALHAGRVAAFIDATLASKRDPARKIAALFDAYAARLEEGGFRQSCPSGTVCLDLEAEMEALRLVVSGTFDEYIGAIARHFDFGGARQSRSFAGMVLTAIEGAYIRGRALRSGDPFREAGRWLAQLAR